jgi:chromate transporter
MNYINEILEIFMVFFRMSAVTFGGGYAMLPILQREIVDRRKWFTQEQIIDYYAVSQGLPGIIAVNVSIFIGRGRKGILGGVAGALGIVAPCLIIITLIAAFLKDFQDNPIVRHAFAGVSVCVAALIFDVVLSLWRKAVTHVLGYLIFAIVFITMLYSNLSPILMIVAAACLGIIKGWLERRSIHDSR